MESIRRLRFFSWLLVLFQFSLIEVQAYAAGPSVGRQLYQAVLRGDLPAVTELLKNPEASPNWWNYEPPYESPLIAALRLGRVEVVRAFRNRPVTPISITDYFSYTTAEGDLRHATLPDLAQLFGAEHMEVIEFIRAEEAKEVPRLMAQSKEKAFAGLLQAIERGTDSEAQFLINSGVNFNQPDSSGNYPLVRAIVHERWEVAASLIEKGADLLALDSTGQTPLHWAAMSRSLSTVKKLIAQAQLIGIQDYVNFKGGSKSTPLSFAMHMGRENGDEKEDIVQFFLENGAHL